MEDVLIRLICSPASSIAAPSVFRAGNREAGQTPRAALSPKIHYLYEGPINSFQELSRGLRSYSSIDACYETIYSGHLEARNCSSNSIKIIQRGLSIQCNTDIDIILKGSEHFPRQPQPSNNNNSLELQMSKEKEPSPTDPRPKSKRELDASEKQNQRITRRMKALMNKVGPFTQNEDEEKCAICLSECGKESATLPCAHAFCMACIGNWWVTNSTCPYCRQHFEFVMDYRGRRMSKEEIPSSFLIQREETLKCEACWADIANDPMRICYECRCVYIHKRCMTAQELKITRWRCEQCLDYQEQQFARKEEKREQKQANYHCSYRPETLELSHRHSQRLLVSQFMEKLK